METLIFYTYEFAASILPFSAAFIFLSHKQKKGGEKTHLLPGLLLFLFSVYIVCVYHVTGTGTLWDAFLYRFQTEISHINPIPFSAGIDMVIANGSHPELLYDIAEGKPAGTRFAGHKEG